MSLSRYWDILAEVVVPICSWDLLDGHLVAQVAWLASKEELRCVVYYLVVMNKEHFWRSDSSAIVHATWNSELVIWRTQKKCYHSI